MARLRQGEYAKRLNQVFYLLRWHYGGLYEYEIAEMLGWDRRVVNNYLRELQQRNKAYRERHLWFAY